MADKRRRKPRDFWLGDCAGWCEDGKVSAVASVGGSGWLADCNIPTLQFQAGRATHIVRMRRLAAWLMDAAAWLEQKAEEQK